jgi:diguanylate cyclase (GGDEF)-like protein
MTLFRQIIVVFTLFFLVMLAVVLAIGFGESREYIENKLYTNAQNTASTLAVTMSQADGDVTKMSVMADAVFDTGYYRKIALKSMRGETIFEKSRDEKPDVPAWFVSMVDLHVESAYAQVSDGWRPLGMLEVVPDATASLEYLYGLFKKIATVFLVSMAVGVLIIALMLRMILRPIRTMEEQAEGVLQNRFLINREIPRTLELRRVTMAINGLVERMEQMHAKLVELTNRNRELEYKDPLTGVYNRRYFVVRYEEYAAAEDERSEGVVVMMRLCGVVEANRLIGFDKVNVILKSLTHIVVTEAESDDDAVVARVSGVEVAVLLPRLDMEAAQAWAENVLQKSREVMDMFEQTREVLYLAMTAVAYEPGKELSKLFASADLALNDAAMHNKDTLKAVSFENSLPLRKEDWRRFLTESLREGRFRATWSSIFSADGGELCREVRLDIYEGQTLVPYRVYAPMLMQLALFDEYAEALFGHLASMQGAALPREVAFEMPMAYLDSTHRFERLAAFAVEMKKRGVKTVVEVSQNELLRYETRTAEALCESLAAHGIALAVTRFDAERRMLDLLKRVRPRYVRIHAGQFADMSDTLRDTLALVLRSIGAKLIVVGAKEEHRRKSFAAKGGDGFID